ncbi:MAG: MerR family transcriptional regulator [Oscillospiraceae bacterium]|nr:MerR family transcriptional regulator [Oscillospiraceae bacterium]
MSKYTTGEMAKLCNVSVRTVQFYDSKELLPPSDLTEGGRRIYNDDDLDKLRFICTLKAIGLSLASIKSVMGSELSEKIFTLLLDEQVKALENEIDERQKQLEMITAIKESIAGKAIAAKSIIDIEHIMEKKNKIRNTKKLALIYAGVALASASQLLLLAWLITSGIWWALVAYALAAAFGIIVALLTLKDNVFICPSCDKRFKISLWRVFFTTGDHKVRWTTCPECGNKNWCVMKKQK